jgi:short-subunit dehydrogenase
MNSGKGKTALVTGATSGIGRELAYIHAQCGGNLILVSCEGNKLDQTRKDLEERYKVSVFCVEKSLCGAAAAKEIYKEVSDAGLTVDYLVNDAGLDGFGICPEKSESLPMIDLNIISLVSLTRLFVPDFVKQGHGRILNISSTAWMIPDSMQETYLATKAFVNYFSIAMSGELADTDITVTSLVPVMENDRGRMGTGMQELLHIKRGYSPKRVAMSGYKAMLNGKMHAYSSISSQRSPTELPVPTISRKAMSFGVRKMQEIF